MCVAGGTLNLVPVFLFLDLSENFSVEVFVLDLHRFICSYYLNLKWFLYVFWDSTNQFERNM